MKAIILILILTTFIQATILPVDLVLLILILRTYITKEKSNLFLAFSIGFLVSHLSLSPLGLQSIIYLIAVQLTQIYARLPYWNTLLTLMPFIVLLLVANTFILALVTNQSINIWPDLILEGIFSIPVYLMIRFWEERFIIRNNTKLKM